FETDRYFDVFVEYAKATAEDLLIEVTIHNRGPEDASLHVLPTLWFRNVWSWGGVVRKPWLSERDGAVVVAHDSLGQRHFYGDGAPQWLFTENESNRERLGWGP